MMAALEIRTITSRKATTLAFPPARSPWLPSNRRQSSDHSETTVFITLTRVTRTFARQIRLANHS